MPTYISCCCCIIDLRKSSRKIKKENTWSKHRKSYENHLGIDTFLLENMTSRDFKFKNDRRKYSAAKKRSNSLDLENDGLTRKET